MKSKPKTSLQSRAGCLAALLLALVGIATWYALPVITFGGRYLHRDSHSVYEFRDGRFFENGKNLGHYVVQFRTVTIQLNFDSANEEFHATIGWNTLSIPLPKYGETVLQKQE